MMAKLSRLLLVVGFALGVIHATTTNAFATKSWCGYHSSSYSCTIEVRGDVSSPGKFALHDIQKLISSKKLAPTTQNVVFISGGDSTSATWSGVLLWDFLNYVGIQAAGRNVVQKTIEIEATDGYFIKFGLGEIAPSYGGHQVILTIYQDGQPLDEGTGFARLIFPGDKSGARNIFSIKSIEVH